MSDAPTDLTPEQRELAYYKRQVDTLAGENLKLEYVISGLRHELKQKRQGFALLSQLQGAIGAHQQISSLLAVALPAIGATLGMDKAVVLSPGRREHSFRPTQWIGFRHDATAAFEHLELDLPAALAGGVERLIVTKATPPTPLIEQIRAAFELPYFVCVPVIVDERPIALLLSGRLRESKPIYPPLDQGDLDTFLAIAGLISASIRNMRVGVLEEMDRLKTEFFANISHEFRTPITLTLGPLEALLNGRYGVVPNEARDQFRVMQRNQERLLALVNQILDLAKLEAGGMRLRAARTPDFNRFVRERAAQFQETAAQRGLALRMTLDPAVSDAEMYVDRAQLDRLLVNLLSNALKFTREGHIEVSTELRDGVVRLGVADTGIGIREDQLPHIFDRFRQADGSESREYAGTGIGLALVQEIARLHGGDVSVSSRHGEGTTFRVTLPVGRAHLDPAAIVERDEEELVAVPLARVPELLIAAEGATDREGTADDNARAEAAFDASRPTILYAEDNPDLRRHVRDLLRGTYNVYLAADGREGLEHARRYQPDLVLSDQMMPNMSGRDLLRALRDDESLRHVPVIFLTARAGTEARIESLQAGADDYLSKPFNEGELLARVRNLLQVREQERRLATLNRRLEARVEEQVAELVRGGELQRFLPSAVVAQVLAGTLNAGEHFERRKITVLAAELFGVAELTEQLEPEELSATINELLRELTAAVVAYGGTLDRLTSDGLLVLFGAPQPMDVPDQAWAAVQTALTVRRRVQELSAAARRRGVGTLAVRVGINTGFCTVGAFGSDIQRRYTAVGHPVTVAERLREAAAEGKILCAAATYSLVEARVRAAPAGPLTLRGSARPVEPHEILAVAETSPANRLPRLPELVFVPK